MAALADHGVTVYKTPKTDGGCVPGAVAILRNVQISGPDKNIAHQALIIAKQGTVQCEIDAAAHYGPSVTTHVYEGGDRIVMDARNVECSIHPHGDHASQQAAAVRAALDRLR